MEIAIIISAFALGFASGFHCVGMCGPIALSMGLSKNQAINFHLQNFTYNFGRIITYSFMGAVLGFVGEGFHIAGFQQILSIIVGILLIVMSFFSFGGGDFAAKIPFLTKKFLYIKIFLAGFLQKVDYKSRFLTGILNGFLPCGMVYMALTASIAAGGIWQGALFMTIFGLGTFPFMFFVVILGNLMTTAFRLKILKIIPIMMIILGSLFILRGLEIGIPYISPKKESLEIHNNSIEHKEGNHETCH
jgi:sulfite exporter TauE/SafE